jgi:intracellular septation protein
MKLLFDLFPILLFFAAYKLYDIYVATAVAIAAGLLPGRLSWQFSRIEPYGLMILLAMLFFGLLGDVLRPPVVLLQGLIFSMLGL